MPLNDQIITNQIDPTFDSLMSSTEIKSHDFSKSPDHNKILSPFKSGTFLSNEMNTVKTVNTVKTIELFSYVYNIFYWDNWVI